MIIYKEMQEVDIRNALDFWKGVPGVHLHDNGEDTYEGVLLYLKRNPGCSFVAIDNGDIVGAILCGHDGRRGFINHLGVAVSYRRKGIATQLVERSLQQFKKEGIKKSALFVLNENEEAMKFYRTIGWGEESIVKIFMKILS